MGVFIQRRYLKMRVAFVTGVDFSKEILNGARDNCREYQNISFKQGDTLHTSLESNDYNLLLERALIHQIIIKKNYRRKKPLELNRGSYFRDTKKLI
ncbi:class I SAM-dependent methyltransferase [Lysinibacillus sphaericus]|uniref:class I SAM-dependent methyltransferase n=1 Tax=Lysinibacillus sphaericus TaxID=1421 RepID=UPI00210B8C99|nr:class I SAM-dependent methyltransferase [Lysinibacillus sphaericus]